MKKIFYLLPLALLAFSCGVSKEKKEDAATTQVETDETGSAKEENGIETLPTYHGAETKYFDLIHTRLDVKFDWDNAHLIGTATLTLKPHYYTQDSLVLDAKSMEIKSVSSNNKPLDFNYKNDYLIIYFPSPKTKNDEVNVQISYIAKPNDKKAGGSAAIMEDKGLYFINNKHTDPHKMPQIWTQGETEGNSVWFPTIDAPNQKMTQEINMTVDNKYTTLSNGIMVKSVKNTDGTRTDSWKTTKAFAPYLTMMAVGEFKVVKDTYTRLDGSKMEVNYYVEPEWEQYAKDIFGETPAMIAYFSKLLGVEYAWDKYSQIVVRDYVSGAMENVGGVVFGDFVYKTKRELIDANDRSTIAHELFHHWFGDLVTTESWSNLPLNESFANYSQYLWDQFREGQDEAEYQAEQEASGYFQTAEAQGMHNLIWYDYDSQEQMFDGHSYNKGGRILNMLRSVVGDSAFFASLKVYLTDNKFGTGEIAQLRLAFEKVTGQDLNWFFNQWFLAKGHPVLKVSKKVENHELALTIEQKQDFDVAPLYRLPMKVSVFDNGSRKDYSIVMDQSVQTFNFPIKDTLSAVIVDADHVLLAKWTNDMTPEEALVQFYHGGKYMDRKDGLLEGLKAKGKAGDQVIMDAMNDPFYHIRELAISKAKRIKDDYKEPLLAKLKTMAVSDPSSSVREKALSFLVDNFKDESGVKDLVVKALNTDSSYAVMGEALLGYAKYDTLAAMNKAKALESETSQGILSNVAALYGKYGSAKELAFFDKALRNGTFTVMNEIMSISSLGSLVKRSDLATQAKAYDLYAYLAENGGMYSKMVLPVFIPQVQQGIQKNIDKLPATDSAAIDAAKALKEKYSSLIEKASNGATIVVQGGDE